MRYESIDAAADPEYKVSEIVTIAKARTLLAVPLLREGEPIGTFNLMRQRVQPFTERQIELVRTFADQAVIAMENARLLGELQARTRDLEKSLEYQTATSDVLNVISRSTFDLQPVLDTLVATAKRLCNADMAIIYRRVGDAYRLAANLGFPPEYEAFARTLSLAPSRASVTQRAALEHRISHVADIAADPEYELPEASESGNARTALGVPLLREGEPDRRLHAGPPAASTPFARSSSHLVEHLRRPGGHRHRERAAADDEAQPGAPRELQESLEYQTATSDVLKVISRSTFDLSPVLEYVVETAIRLCRAHMGSIFRLEDGVYRWAVGYALDPAYREIEERNPITPGTGTLVGRVALEGRALQIADALSDPDYAVKDEAQLTRARTMLGVPLLREGAPIRRHRHGARPGRALQRQGDRAGHNVRRSGGHRNRECSAIDRAARGLGAADSDCRGVEGYLRVRD